MILNDEEIEAIKDATMYEGPDSFEYDYDGIISKVQAAVIAKLAAGVSVEPVAWIEALSGSVGYGVYAAAKKLPEGVKFDLCISTPQAAVAAARVQMNEEAARVAEKYFHTQTAKSIRALIGVTP